MDVSTIWIHHSSSVSVLFMPLVLVKEIFFILLRKYWGSCFRKHQVGRNFYLWYFGMEFKAHICHIYVFVMK